MKIIDQSLLNKVSSEAKESPRLRMNYNFHQSLDDKCHRFLNAVEPGTVVEIHRHPTKDETFVLLRGRVVVYTYNDDGSVLESVELNPNEGRYGVVLYSLNARKDRLCLMRRMESLNESHNENEHG